MGEKIAISVLIIIFLLLGAGGAYLSLVSHEFTFDKSEITVNGTLIHERLSYVPNEPLHTLYRNFDSNIVEKQYYGEESISVYEVKCSAGEAYARDSYGNCRDFAEGNYTKSCLDYTENNEYGCSFGDVRGFAEGVEQYIEVTYSPEPPALFRYKDNYYIKFIAYDPGKHPYLKLNENFFVDGALSASGYFPSDKVIMYIQYDPGAENLQYYKINSVDALDFGTSSYVYLLLLLSAIFPALFTFCIWFFMCRKPAFDDVPEELSEIPEKIMPWEVAAIFDLTPTQAVPATLLDLYRKKVIDIDVRDEKGFWGESKVVYVKFLKSSDKLDKLEKSVYEILKIAEKMGKSAEKGYFKLNDSSFSLKNISLRNTMQSKGRDIMSLLSETQKKSVRYAGQVTFIMGLIFGSIILSALLAIAGSIMFFMPVAELFVMIIVWVFVFIFNKTLFLRFRKEKDYESYLKWQAFKRFLKWSYSMKASDVKGIILWNEYLVYATALGVSEKILKRLRKEGIISEEQYNSSVVMAASMSSFAGSSGSGGASGGAGGGGAGGGGGGGR